MVGMNRWLLSIRWLAIASVLLTAARAFSPEIAEMIHSWAPQVWLHSEEQFMPSSVDFFLENVVLQNRKGRVLDQQPATTKLPGGPTTTALHLQSKQKLSCPACLGPPFLHGSSVVQGGVPVYAIARDYQDAWNTVDVVYHTFYPYNRGKPVCIGIASGKKDDNCLGNVESFGNHLGDWEHVTMRFQNGKPHTLYLSVHNFGVYYVWNETAGRFHLQKGESPKEKAARRGRKRKFARDLLPIFPAVLQVSGKHPVLYSANGSHGLWASSGRHTYSPFPLLEDFTDQGTAWNTWENLIIIPWNDTPYPYIGQLGWLNFRGRWGNAKNGCDLEPISGECRLNHGPIFPGGPDDIPPPRIQRSRNHPQLPVVTPPPPYYLVRSVAVVAAAAAATSSAVRPQVILPSGRTIHSQMPPPQPPPPPLVQQQQPQQQLAMRSGSIAGPSTPLYTANSRYKRRDRPAVSADANANANATQTPDEPTESATLPSQYEEPLMEIA